MSMLLMLAVTTFCNPMPLPDYPLGQHARGVPNGSPINFFWNNFSTSQFRELADPTLYFEDGVWYLYPSVDMCWRSVDNGGTWEHIPLGLNGVDDNGASDVMDYAPTIVKHRGKYYLVGSMALLHVADSPLGPWRNLGKMKIPTGEVDGVAVPHFWDPALFSDDDGRLYLYWGCTAGQGIWGVELDADNPLEYIGEPHHLIAFEPEECPYERMYGWDFGNSWIEGAWMVKVDGRYHLSYSAGGADPRYAIASATGTEPLGRFVKQANNPIYHSIEGVVKGTGHGSIVKGPDGEYWVASCVEVMRNHKFERMLAFDRIGYDHAKGEFTPTKASAVPQYLPQSGKRGKAWDALAGTVESGRGAIADDDLRSVWVPESLPASAEIVFGAKKTLCAFRLVWRDIGLDEERGVKKGPFQYRVWARNDGEWSVAYDASGNEQDFFVDYREVGPVDADAVRLEVLGGPKGITPSVDEFTPFGLAKDFEAKPIWPVGREKERNLNVGFRCRFDGANAGRLRYSASTIARVWLNGEFLAYGPARGPHGIDRIDEIDLEGRVHAGENILAIEVAGYNIDTFYLINEPAYLIAEVLDGEGRIIARTGADGDFEATVIDERVQKVPRFSFQRPFCEVYRLKTDSFAWRTGAKRELVEVEETADIRWMERTAPYPDYVVSGLFAPMRKGALEKREDIALNPGRSVTGEEDPARGYSPEEVEVQPVFEVQKLCETSRTALPAASKYPLKAKSYLMFDHGFCDTGFIGAKVVCRRPGRVYFHYDEVLVDGEVIDVQRMGWQCVNTVTYDFTEPGVYEVESFEPGVFRYLKVMSDDFDGEISGIYLRSYKNALASRAEFETDDEKLNMIFEACRETLIQNAVDVLTDCPSRERAGWCCDSFFSSRTEKILTGVNPVERCFLENFAFAETYPGIPEGFLPMCYPAEAWLLPNWNLWLVIQLGEYAQRTGDRVLIEAMREKVKGVIEAFRKYRNEDGLLEKLPGWVFIEWSFANELVQDVNYPSNMTWAKALDVAAGLYGWTDCAEEAERVRRTVREQSWTGEWFCDNAVRQEDGTLKLSGECTETCQYYAFYFDTATKEEYPALWDTLVRDFGPQRRQTELHSQIHFANAFVGNYLRLELLSRDGRAAQILEESKGYFAKMAEQTGTMWEHDWTNNSCDHGFASHVAYLFYRDILGLKTIDYTGRRITLHADRVLELGYARGVVPLGESEVIEVGWHKDVEGNAVFDYRAPDGWKITVE